MADKKLKQPIIDDTTLTLQRWEVSTRILQVPVDKADPEKGTSPKEHKRITSWAKPDRGEQTSNPQLWQAFLDRHTFDEDRLSLSEVETALLADHNADRYE
jgi:hypothetical protein